MEIEKEEEALIKFDIYHGRKDVFLLKISLDVMLMSYCALYFFFEKYFSHFWKLDGDLWRDYVASILLEWIFL